jgi:hypothetical protein
LLKLGGETAVVGDAAGVASHERCKRADVKILSWC